GCTGDFFSFELVSHDIHVVRVSSLIVDFVINRNISIEIFISGFSTTDAAFTDTEAKIRSKCHTGFSVADIRVNLIESDTNKDSSVFAWGDRQIKVFQETNSRVNV